MYKTHIHLSTFISTCLGQHYRTHISTYPSAFINTYRTHIHSSALISTCLSTCTETTSVYPLSYPPAFVNTHRNHIRLSTFISTSLCQHVQNPHIHISTLIHLPLSTNPAWPLLSPFSIFHTYPHDHTNRIISTLLLPSSTSSLFHLWRTSTFIHLVLMCNLSYISTWWHPHPSHPLFHICNIILLLLLLLHSFVLSIYRYPHISTYLFSSCSPIWTLIFSLFHLPDHSTHRYPHRSTSLFRLIHSLKHSAYRWHPHRVPSVPTAPAT